MPEKSLQSIGQAKNLNEKDNSSTEACTERESLNRTLETLEQQIRDAQKEDARMKAAMGLLHSQGPGSENQISVEEMERLVQASQKSKQNVGRLLAALKALELWDKELSERSTFAQTRASSGRLGSDIESEKSKGPSHQTTQGGTMPDP